MGIKALQNMCFSKGGLRAQPVHMKSTHAATENDRNCSQASCQFVLNKITRILLSTLYFQLSIENNKKKFVYSGQQCRLKLQGQ